MREGGLRKSPGAQVDPSELDCSRCTTVLERGESWTHGEEKLQLASPRTLVELHFLTPFIPRPPVPGSPPARLDERWDTSTRREASSQPRSRKAGPKLDQQGLRSAPDGASDHLPRAEGEPLDAGKPDAS